MAPTGHTEAQDPQLTHESSLMTLLSSTSEMASDGHSPSQAPQLMQASVAILYAIIVPRKIDLLKYSIAS